MSCTVKTTEQRPTVAEDTTLVYAAELTLTSYYHKHSMGAADVCFLASKQYCKTRAMIGVVLKRETKYHILPLTKEKLNLCAIKCSLDQISTLRGFNATVWCGQ